MFFTIYCPEFLLQLPAAVQFLMRTHLESKPLKNKNKNKRRRGVKHNGQSWPSKDSNLVHLTQQGMPTFNYIWISFTVFPVDKNLPHGYSCYTKVIRNSRTVWVVHYQNPFCNFTFISYKLGPKSRADRFLWFPIAAFLYDVEKLRSMVETMLLFLILSYLRELY